MRVFSILPFVFLALTPGSAQPLRGVNGEWGDKFDMKVIPIHAMLLPDGQVLAYGTNHRGAQGGDLYYEVWDTRNGKHEVSGNHKLLQHATKTDIFCSTLNMDVKTGNILIMGGDDGDNFGVADALEFNSRTHEIRKHPRGNMKYPRWYGTSINLPNGDIFVAGGRAASKEDIGSPIPEVFNSETGFRELKDASMPGVVRRTGWWYPHCYVNSHGDIICIIGNGENTDIYRIGVEGDGTITKIGTKEFFSDKLGASIMFDVDKVAFLDNDGVLWVADLWNSSKVVFTRMKDTGPGRTNAAMSPLPDGRVVITGGCRSTEEAGNDETKAVMNVQIWDPTTNELFTGPDQQEIRLYHSSGLVLPDATWFSAGGGAPGPKRQLNGQIYTPNYLFNKETGALAQRPEIKTAPRSVKAGRPFRITVDNARKVKKVTALKAGSMTHARNCDARWLNLTFDIVSNSNGKIEITPPNNNIFIPGIWTLYTLDENGVPAPGKIIRVRP